MSVAGTRSNRGDAYQLAIALQEAVLLLSDPDRAWIEVDSTQLMADQTPITVDDVVVGYHDGRVEYIQCKKNQPDFSNWTVGDLADELKKAARLLSVQPQATVRFFSRGDFRNLAKLRDKAAEVSNEGAFLLNVGKDLQPALKSLSELLRGIASAPSPFAFLQKVRFTGTDETEDVVIRTRALLRAMVSHENAAHNALWHALDTAGANLGSSATMPAKARFSKDDLIQLLAGVGCTVGASKNLADIERELWALSAIGRQWQRDIGGRVFDRVAVAELRGHIDNERRTILLTDGPGAGKTCVLLSLADELERLPTVVTVFIQAREFSDAETPEAREVLGFPRDLFALVSAASEHKHVVVLVDSLDVLSIARETESLKFFLALLDRLAVVPNVTIVAACRNFDLQYNHKLKSRRWSERVEVGLLDWESTVRPTLESWPVDCDQIDRGTRELLLNPRNLSLYREIVDRGGSGNAVSAQDLTEHYLEAVVLDDERLGDSAMVAVETMATSMLQRRRLDVGRRSINLDERTLQTLLSARVLFSGRPGWFGFAHQTLLDALAVRDARRKDQSLLEFIRSLPQVPFVRPAVRAFFAHVRKSDAREHRIQLRAAFDADIAFHLKRLLAESFAEVEPEDEDWNLVRHLYRNHDRIFRSLYSSVRSVRWFEHLHSRLVSIWENERNVEWLQIHIRRVATWLPEKEDVVLAFWHKAARSDWLPGLELRRLISIQLHNAVPADWGKTQPLLTELGNLPAEQHDFLGQVIEKVILETGHGDDLLWQFISRDVTDQALMSYRFDTSLRVEHVFKDKDFLLSRFTSSEWLLTTAVDALERWSVVSSRYDETSDGATVPRNDKFLEQTSYGDARTYQDLAHRSNGELFVHAIERAILSHATSKAAWWTSNGMRICLSRCGALRYIGALALMKQPQGNEHIASAVFARLDSFEDFDVFELGALIRGVAYFVPETAEAIEAGVRHRSAQCGTTHSEHARKERLELFRSIPAPLRSAPVCDEIEPLYQRQVFPPPRPTLSRAAGLVRPPIRAAELLQLSDDALLELLHGALGLHWTRTDFDRLVGGLSELIGQVQQASTTQPARFMSLLETKWRDLDARHQAAIFEGIGRYLQRERGELDKQSRPADTLDSDCDVLANKVLEELERHSLQWRGTTAGNEALEGSVHCLALDDEAAARLVFWIAGQIDAAGADSVRVDDESLELAGFNCNRGQVADMLLVIANQRLKNDKQLPELLLPLLTRLSIDSLPAVRAMTLRRLAYFIHRRPDAWFLLENAVACGDARIWKSAEQCLYYSYTDRYPDVRPMLDSMRSSGLPSALESWARISCLAALAGLVDAEDLTAELQQLQVAEAWKGACTVWFANANKSELRERCFSGLTASLENPDGAGHVLQGMSQLFRQEEDRAMPQVPQEFLRRVLERARELGQRANIFGVPNWCAALADRNPAEGLAAMETLAELSDLQSLFYEGPEALPALLTAMFQEAEECEGSDGGDMLRRVITLQDRLLEANNDSLHNWLRAAERQ